MNTVTAEPRIIVRKLLDAEADEFAAWIERWQRLTGEKADAARAAVEEVVFRCGWDGARKVLAG